MKLIIDYGNTLIKVALFRGDIVIGLKTFKSITTKKIYYCYSNRKSYVLINFVRNFIFIRPNINKKLALDFFQYHDKIV